MDVICKRCGEPWDNDTIHEEVAERHLLGERADYSSVAKEFRRFGCAAFRAFMGKPQDWRCESHGTVEASYADAIYEVCGDDMDAAASLLDDARAMGLTR